MDITLDPTGISATAQALAMALSAISTAFARVAETNRLTASQPLRDLDDAMQVQIWLDLRHLGELTHLLEPPVFDFKALLEGAQKK